MNGISGVATAERSTLLKSPRPAKRKTVPPKVGDTAYGVIQLSNPQGARVELLSHGSIIG